MQFTGDVQFALQTVQEAALLVREIQGELTAQALSKADRSPVTVADFAAQALVAHQLRTAGSCLPLVAEETSEALVDAAGGETLQEVTRFLKRRLAGITPEGVCELVAAGQAECEERFWTLDPVDGTKGFLRGEQYAVCLALIAEGKVQIGALACPNLNSAALPEVGGVGSAYLAIRREGAFVGPLQGAGDFRALQVSQRADPSAARLLRSVEAGHTDGDKIGELAAYLGTKAPPVCLDSQAKYAVLAAGEGDILLRLLSPSRRDYREKIWDQAAGSILVTEAGGTVTDLSGAALDFSQGRTLAANRGVVATNGQFHSQCLSGLTKLEA